MTTTSQESGIRNHAAIASMQELEDRVSVLKGRLEFGDARQTLESPEKQQFAANDQDRQWVAQQLALCTYKDEELHPSVRCAKALAMLEVIGLRDLNCSNAETLALGGAIYKRMWQQG